MTVVTKKWAPPSDQELVRQAQNCFSVGSKHSAEDAEYIAVRIKDSMVKALALSIIHQPLLTPDWKYRDLDRLAVDVNLVQKEAYRSRHYGTEEELRSVFRRLGTFIDCYKRSDQLKEVEGVLYETFDAETPVQITLDFLNNDKEYFLKYFLPYGVNSEWISGSFQRKFELVPSAQRMGIREPRDYNLSWPNIDEELVLVSRSGSTTWWQEKIDFSPQRARLKIQNQESVLKEFTRCTHTETAQVLRRLSDTRDSTQTLVCGRTFAEAGQALVYWAMKVDSPTVSCLAFRRTIKGYDSEVLMRVQGIWVSRQAQITPSATGVEDKVKKQAWPWNLTFDLGNGQKVDLTETAPCFVEGSRSFQVREISDDEERNRAHLLNFGIMLPPEIGPQVWEFTTLSPTLLHPDETETLPSEIARIAGVPLGVAHVIALYADFQGLTIPRQLLNAPQQS